MAKYNTPGVYVQEISTLPPSVAQVATAIPAFIGYTETGSGIKRIDTLLDYETAFGKAKPSAYAITVDENRDNQGNISYNVKEVSRDLDKDKKNVNPFLMHYGLSLYFLNGGGSCYIVSVGNYDSDLSKTAQAFKDGLSLLEKEDEPTLIVLLDAVSLLKNEDYYDLCDQTLKQCNKLGDRFLIADVAGGDWETFRNKMPIGKLLTYGAAYHPYLKTLLNYQPGDVSVSINALSYQLSTTDVITVTYTGGATSPKLIITSSSSVQDKVDFDTRTTADTLSITIATPAPTGAEVATVWSTWISTKGNDAAGFDIQKNGDGSVNIATAPSKPLTKAVTQKKLEELQSTNTALYNKLKLQLNDERVTLPPSPAIAGIYASVDRERGVWKTPANVSVAGVLGPVSKISDTDQDRLNIDPTGAGKSINAIRDFTGKGTLVWGGRTLAGDDNEWRYVSVRRLFITIEESTRKATNFAVFEPNDATTWLKVKAMIESYLYGLWEQGALAGSKPESAYFVNIGLGKTMTTQDILEGRMNVEIGIAAVRPAEFIILKFTHKLQQA
jgi:phage tail sheath protein FI